jgi:hypothetical protein
MLERFFGRHPLTYTPTPEIKKPEYFSFQLPLTIEMVENDNGDMDDS